MKNKKRIGEKSMEAGAISLGEFWSMVENFWSILELEFEDPSCQA
jgi:hypothetical protein